MHIPAQAKKLVGFFYRPLPSGYVSFRQRMHGSKHLVLELLNIKMVFSFVRGDFGIRIVCCFSFGKYCLSQSRTLLKYCKTFLHLNTRARFWQASFVGVVSRPL